jgi:DNA-binding HxlR family transcriptional regulator
MKSTDSRDECLAVGEVLQLIGDKWTVMVVGVLSTGTKRFNELRRLIGGVSQRMLTLTLRRLEEEGLVLRTAFPTIPPRVDYELTAHGRTLIAPLKTIGDWAIKHRARAKRAPASRPSRTSPTSPKSPASRSPTP